MIRPVFLSQNLYITTSSSNINSNMGHLFVELEGIVYMHILYVFAHFSSKFFTLTIADCTGCNGLWAVMCSLIYSS